MKTRLLTFVLLLGSMFAAAQNLLDYSEQEILAWYEDIAVARDAKTKDATLEQLSKSYKKPEKMVKSLKGMMKYLGAFDKSGMYAFAIGQYYDWGMFTSKNKSADVMKYYGQAVEKGYPVAKFQTADILVRGKYGNRDYNKAYTLLQECSQFPEALFLKGLMQFYGMGTTKDEAGAFRTFLSAAQSREAQYFAGLQYEHGRGCEQNYTLACNQYTIAKNLGFAEAETRYEIMEKATQKYEEIRQVYVVAGNTQAAPQQTQQQVIQQIAAQTELDENVDKNIPVTGQKNKNTFVVIITNEEYGVLANVPFAIRDGEYFAQYCNKTLGIPEDNIRITKNATYGNMLAAMDDIKQIADAYKGNLNVIFYYAGHGAPDERSKEAYLIPADAYGVNPKVCYALKDLYSDLSNLGAKQVTVFLDACFSGAARSDEGKMLASARGVAISVKKDVPAGQMVVFSATSESETALPYQKQKHGLFTYFLLKKLQETQGNVTLKELGDYVIEQVSQQSIVINRKAQTPTVTPSGNASDWMNWKL